MRVSELLIILHFILSIVIVSTLDYNIKHYIILYTEADLKFVYEGRSQEVVM